jgi:hypothetical protein
MNNTLTKQTTEYRQLDSKDRCDKCGDCSQAFVRAVKMLGSKEYELLFCGHHYNEYNAVLLAGGWLVQDERNSINVKPMSGASNDAFTNED